MANTIEKLILELQAKISKYNSDILDAAKKTEAFQKRSEKAFSSIEKRSKRAGDSLFKFSNVAKGVFAAIGARGFINFADSITLADNQLRNATANTEQFNFVLMELNRIANETRQDVNVLTGVFAKFTRAGQEAGFSTRELLDFTESLTKAFKLEGNSVAEVNSVLGQLVQSFRKGNIDGEEFRALSEGSTLALQALAKQLRVNIGDLKEMGAQGKISARDLVEGLANIAPQIDSEFKTLEPTFFEVGTRFGNLFALGFRGGALEETVSTLKRKLLETADDLERFFTGKENKSVEQIEGFIETAEKARLKLLELEQASGLDFGGRIRNFTDDIKALEVRLKAAKVAAEGADTPAVTEEKREPLVVFGAPEDKIVAQGARRLTIIEKQAKAERDLLEAVDQDIISDAEARAIRASQKEIDRLNEQFTRTLERLETNQAKIDEIKALAEEIGLEKLTEDERKLIDLEQSAADARVVITEKELAKRAKIRAIEKRVELANTVTNGARILGAISNLAKKGTSIQKNAAIASIIANTAAGVMRQFKDTPFQKALPQAIAVGLEGAAALAAIGGGGGAPAVSVSESAPIVDEEADIPSTLDVSVTDISEEGTAVGRLILDASAGTSSDQFLADAFNDAVRTGRITGRGL